MLSLKNTKSLEGWGEILSDYSTKEDVSDFILSKINWVCFKFYMIALHFISEKNAQKSLVLFFRILII